MLLVSSMFTSVLNWIIGNYGVDSEQKTWWLPHTECCTNAGGILALSRQQMQTRIRSHIHGFQVFVAVFVVVFVAVFVRPLPVFVAEVEFITKYYTKKKESWKKVNKRGKSILYYLWFTKICDGGRAFLTVLGGVNVLLKKKVIKPSEITLRI